MKLHWCCILSIFFYIPFAGAQQKNSIDMEMVTIPSGTFYMGANGGGDNVDEAPIHQVTLSRPYRMSITEVTNAQYEQFAPEHKHLRGKDGLSTGDDEAVIYVSYFDAIDFCRWLSKKEGKTYRLPTEAEWEYACRAGSYLPYSMDDRLSAMYLKRQSNVWGVDTTVNLKVKTTPPNSLGMYDMHGNVEEWCFDWYAPYISFPQTDPIGPADGLFRVTRGGSHSTPVDFLRSANRLAMIPEDKHWLTGFRVVQGEMPKTLATPVLSSMTQQVSVLKHNWPKPERAPFFKEPLVYVNRPECNAGIPFYNHNHCPAVTWCDNGDLLAIWFSTNDEAGREMTILSSRLRVGNKEWDTPSEFFKVPDRNMTGSSLFHANDGSLIHINGVEVAGTWQNLAMVMRTSEDNGDTWSRPRIISSGHAMRHQVIAGMIQTREGWLAQTADATPGSSGGTALHISKDGGENWEDAGVGVANCFENGATGGSIAGIHAGVVQLSNGDFLALGRGNNLVNTDGIERMPKSVSKDQGKTWIYSPSEFPPIDGGQRLVLTRLNEGPILLVSFTNHPYRLKDGLKGMTFTDENRKEYIGYGMFAALSFDEGKTWPLKKLLTDGKERFLDGGAWTGCFEMNFTHAEPRGYLAVTQTPDQTIHLLSSRNHYRFNLPWLLSTNGYKLSNNNLKDIFITDAFWGERLIRNTTITVPDVLDKCESYGRIQNFAVAGGLQSGKFKGGSSWDDSDLFKALEAAANQYALHKDEKLRLYMDSVISLLSSAQEEDGYLVTAMRINKEKNLPWNIRAPRFSYMIWSHELYNFGHLYEGAVAHYEATGQTNFLSIAIKNADLLVRTFLRGDSLNKSVDGSPEVKIGLIKLWKVTGNVDYLLLANKFMELRGDAHSHLLYLNYDEGRNPYFFQDYKPVKEYEAAYGHGVRALYMYSSMADLGVYMQDSSYFSTLERLWKNIVCCKMYITGGIGSRHKGEAFGENYELPNAQAYNETCSSIGNILWHYRMFRHTSDGKYMDVCERILYNAFLAGWGLNGCEYNYVNPLESDGSYAYNKGANKRQPWFDTSCCPTNISRFIPLVPEMIYSTDKDDVYVNLFISGMTSISLKTGKVDISMDGNYPWNGNLNIQLNPEKNASFALRIRIPSWVDGYPLPESDLYKYVSSSKESFSIKVNGKLQSGVLKEKGYAVIHRTWKKGDKVTLQLPMTVRKVQSNLLLIENKGKVAIECGPIVYCAEEVDNGSLEEKTISLSSDSKLNYEADLLGGVNVIRCNNIKLIPYYSWGNRGANQMKVWLNTTPK